MWEEDNELFVALIENIHWTQKPKYQKAVSVNQNESNIRLRNWNHYTPSSFPAGSVAQ